MRLLRVVEALGLMGSVCPEDFATALAVVRFNAFRLDARRSAALFDRASLLNHSCCPSARFDFDPGSGSIAVASAKTLEPDEEVTICYLDAFSMLQSTELRRMKLEDRLFCCQCPRCRLPLDPGRGFCCPRPDCSGCCLLPAVDEPSASGPCNLCGAVLQGLALDSALKWESQYGFVVEHGDLSSSATVAGLAFGASAVFRQHWLLSAILMARARHLALEGDAAAQEAQAARREANAGRAAALAPWPWLLEHLAGDGP